MDIDNLFVDNLFGHYSMMVKRIFYNSVNPHLTEDSRSSFQTENGWEGIFNMKAIFLKESC